jgi:hypothetical protein
MFDLTTLPRIPERPLDPPASRRIATSWTAEFKMMIGDEGHPVRVTCEVTSNDELATDTLYVETLNYIDLTALINTEHREQIESHFTNHFDEIYGENHD